MLNDVTNLTNKGTNKVSSRNAASVELLADIFKEHDIENIDASVDRRYNISFKYTSTPMGTIVEEESEGDGSENVDVDRSNILTRVDTLDSIERSELVRLVKSFEGEQQEVTHVGARGRKSIGVKKTDNSKVIGQISVSKQQRAPKARNISKPSGSAGERTTGRTRKRYALEKIDISNGSEGSGIKEGGLSKNANDSKQTNLSEKVKKSSQSNLPKNVNKLKDITASVSKQRKPNLSKHRNAISSKQREASGSKQPDLPKTTNSSKELEQEKIPNELQQTARLHNTKPTEQRNQRISKVPVSSEAKVNGTFKNKTRLKADPSDKHIDGKQPPPKNKTSRKNQAAAKTNKRSAMRTKFGSIKSPLQILDYLKVSTHQFTKAEILALCSQGRDPIDLMQ
ncbi:hypothetical protein CLIB1423_25S00188 [[Candida] railenensis]|uniref:Uncharacterized protein n=1 Tax=[Candida] railenensis TaxID=45579 RepID=A0A9P0QVZ8_9ASCO|nr:hypothetical protein CLIB1423_25S00188 [[Candida] railenensis]